MDKTQFSKLFFLGTPINLTTQIVNLMDKMPTVRNTKLVLRRYLTCSATKQNFLFVKNSQILLNTLSKPRFQIKVYIKHHNIGIQLGLKESNHLPADAEFYMDF